MSTRSFAALLIVVLLTTGCAPRDQSDARREQDSSLPRVVRVREGKVIFWLKPDAVEGAKGLGRNLDDVVRGAAAPVVRTRMPVERTRNGFSVPATCLVGPGTRSDIRSLAVLCAQKRSLQARLSLHPRDNPALESSRLTVTHRAFSGDGRRHRHSVSASCDAMPPAVL
jgi:hypothetical protein